MTLMKSQIHGLLFTTDFLNEGIRQTPGWNASENDFIIFRDEIKKIFSTAQNNTVLNEAQTEDEVILPVLAALGWTDLLRQANTSQQGRHDVPDFLLLKRPGPGAKDRMSHARDLQDGHAKIVV